MPLGSVPLSVMVAAGYPVVVTVYVLETPVAKVAVAGLVIVGAPSFVRVNAWTTLPAAFVAVMVIG
jgi:hypothetical protein